MSLTLLGYWGGDSILVVHMIKRWWWWWYGLRWCAGMKISEEIQELSRKKTDKRKWWIWCAFQNDFQVVCFSSTYINVLHDFMINRARNTSVITTCSEIHEHFLQSHNLKCWVHRPAYLPNKSKEQVYRNLYFLIILPNSMNCSILSIKRNNMIKMIQEKKFWLLSKDFHGIFLSSLHNSEAY